MDLVSVPGVAGPNLAPRITFSYAPVNMQALADGTHVGRDAGHSGHGHGHTHGAHGHGHGHSHGAHGHSHAHTASHQIPGPAMPPTHQTHAHQQPAAAHSHSHGQEHTSASGSTLDAIESFIQQERANMIIPTPTRERPRVRGRMTPYAFFVQERRDYYRQQGVPVQFTAFSKECSSLWKVISEEEKQKYQKLAEEDRDRYRREVMGNFDKSPAKDGSRRGRRKKEPGQPKRNMCAFLHFCSAKRPKLKQENPSLSVGALAKQLSSAWKLMTPEQKKPYDILAEKDKQRYEQQKQAYEAGYSAAILKTDVPGGVGQPGIVMTTPRHRRRKKDPDMPRRNMSAFMFYSLEKRPGVKALNPDFGVGKLAQSLAKEWNVLSTTDRQPFMSMAQKDKERYVAELKAYKKGLYTGHSPSVRQIAGLIRGRPLISGSEGDEDDMEVMAGGMSDKIGVAGPGQSPSTDGEEHDLERLCEFYQ